MARMLIFVMEYAAELFVNKVRVLRIVDEVCGHWSSQYSVRAHRVVLSHAPKPAKKTSWYQPAAPKASQKNDTDYCTLYVRTYWVLT